MISVITPTADRPVAFELCESMMCRQTLQPAEWIVADGGQTPIACTMGQVHVHEPRPPGAENFAMNLLNAIGRAKGDFIAVVEDDDSYAPTHLEATVAQLAANPHALAAGDPIQRYYNVAHRCWRVFNNVGASLCQTVMRREALPLFEKIIRGCLAGKTYGVDTTFWRAIPKIQWALTRTDTVVGIKGLPGRVGLGVGHRPDARWTADPELRQLRAWIGDDAETYAAFRVQRAA